MKISKLFFVAMVATMLIQQPGIQAKYTMADYLADHAANKAKEQIAEQTMQGSNICGSCLKGAIRKNSFSNS